MQEGDFWLLNKQQLAQQKLGGQEIFPFKIESKTGLTELNDFLNNKGFEFDTFYASKDILLLKVK